MKGPWKAPDTTNRNDSIPVTRMKKFLAITAVLTALGHSVQAQSNENGIFQGELIGGDVQLRWASSGAIIDSDPVVSATEVVL